MCQELQQACGTGLGARSARGMAEAFTNKRAKRAERRGSERTDSSGWLKRLAQAAGSSGWLTGQTQTGSAQAAGSSGWLTGQTTRGRLLGADANGRARRRQEMGGPKATPLRLAFEVIRVFLRGIIPRYKVTKNSPYTQIFRDFFLSFLGGFFGVWPAKPAEGRLGRQRGGKAASCYMGHIM